VGRGRREGQGELVDALWRSAYRVGFKLIKLYWRVRQPTLTGAYVAVWQGGRLLCIRNSYRRMLSLPAGGLERGERPIDAALRELREEVGMVAAAEALEYVGVVVSHAGATEDHAHFFELRLGERDALEFAVDRREVTWAGMMAPEAALDQGVVDVVRQYLHGAATLPGGPAGPS